MSVRKGEGEADGLHFVCEQELLDCRPLLAAILLGPADAEQSVASHPSHRPAELGAAAFEARREFVDERGHHQLGEMAAQVVAEAALLRREIELYLRCSPRSRQRAAPW
jgi:hypothetical protein